MYIHIIYICIFYIHVYSCPSLHFRIFLRVSFSLCDSFPFCASFLLFLSLDVCHFLSLLLPVSLFCVPLSLYIYIIYMYLCLSLSFPITFLFCPSLPSCLCLSFSLSLLFSWKFRNILKDERQHRHFLCAMEQPLNIERLLLSRWCWEREKKILEETNGVVWIDKNNNKGVSKKTGNAARHRRKCGGDVLGRGSN